ncbi:MAG: flavodoxin-dependent (E)-4-hydroxy-3-methylbut-2-enyl-diphosphate synthase [Armatimonadota bacterium]
MERRITKKVFAGNIGIGGNSPISVQSMTNTKTQNVESTISQLKAFEMTGCDIARVAVPDMESAKAIKKIKKAIKIPLVADIHFDYKLAIESLKSGVDKLRINPGNIGSENKVIEVAKAAKDYNVPIRIGVNAGSIDKKKYGKPSAEALVHSALDEAETLEKAGFTDIVLSLKTFDVPMMIDAYQMVANRCEYPLHLGVTESGLPWEGTIRSSVGIGALLAQGIGDTIRVSLTGDPVEEVKIGIEILNSLGLKEKKFTIISCPTCGRTTIDIESISNEVKNRLEKMNIIKPISVAVMGCVVNGPGEAQMADVGISGTNEYGILFSNGEPLKKVKSNELIDELIAEVEKIQIDKKS